MNYRLQHSKFEHNMKPTNTTHQPITEQAINGLWGFYPEIMDLKKHKKKCCKKYKEGDRCKKCPQNC